MKCLQEGVKTKDGDLILSIFDYGGQQVFDVIHQFFLTSKGVYLCVFDMCKIISDDINIRNTCIATIKFWIHSIIVHTEDKNGNSAPIVFVGTCKDLVYDAVILKTISDDLVNYFGKIKSMWKCVIKNTEEVSQSGLSNPLCFFPVNNKAGILGDSTFGKLMSKIEFTIKKSDYVNVERPISWLQSSDKMVNTKVTNLNIDSVFDIMNECKVPISEIDEMLSFFHEMGIVMWHNEPALRSTIIVDPVKFFVQPTTLLIRKYHATDGIDKTVHMDSIHEECKMNFPEAWDLLVNRGIVDESLLKELLRSHSVNYNVIIELMKKFGLIVLVEYWRYSDSDSAISLDDKDLEIAYFVPALLIPAPKNLSESWSDFSRCYFVCSTQSDLSKMSSIQTSDLISDCFLPHGLFDLLIGKAFLWWQQTCPVENKTRSRIKDIKLTKDIVVLYFGAQMFRMQLISKFNCIVVDIASSLPRTLFGNLKVILEDIINETMKSLRCFPALAYNKSIKEASEVSDISLDNPETFLVPMDEILKIAAGESVMNIRHGGNNQISSNLVKKLYSQWIPTYKFELRYDIFISYRQNKAIENDSTFSAKLVDSLHNSMNRSIEVFRDEDSLVKGKNFQSEFVKALLSSTVIVPLISKNALLRMQKDKFNPFKEDNVLIEWIIAVYCEEKNLRSNIQSKHCKVAAICPIMIGDRLEGNPQIVTNLFTDGILDLISTDVPTKTLQDVKKLLEANDIQFPSEWMNYTVKYFVESIMKYNTKLLLWEMTDYSRRTTDCAKAIVHLLLEIIRSDINTNDNNNYNNNNNGPMPTLIQTTSSAPSSTMRDLKNVTINELENIFKNLKLSKYVEDIVKNEITGELLSFVANENELKDLFPTIIPVHARMIYTYIQQFLKDGVDLSKYE